MLTTEDHTLVNTLPQDKYFDTSHLKADLKGHSIRGGAVTLSAQVAKFLLQTGSTVVLARLLTPQDFGLVAMVMAITNFAMIFKDLGLSSATIQRPEVNHAQISSLFWINTGIGLALAVVTAAASPAVAWFYGEPRLVGLTIALAGAFIFAGLTIQHQAVLRRHLRFAALAAIEVVATAVGVGTAILAGYYGAKYWSLVLMQVTTAGTVAAGVWLALGWRPGWPRWRSGVGSMLAFGGNVSGFHFVNYLSRNLDHVLLGRSWGPHILGLYGRAYGLLMLPISQLTTPLGAVAMPALSRLQDDPERYASYYTRLLQLLSFLSMPLVAFLAVCSKDVIHLLLGEQWLGASRIFQILALTAFIQPVSSSSGVVLLSLGQSGRLLKLGIFNSSIVVFSFVIGVRWGAIGVASAYAVANYLILFPMLWYSFRQSPMSVMAFLRAISRPTICSLSMALAILSAHTFLAGQADILIVGVCFVVGLCTYFLIWTLIPGGTELLRDFSGYIKLIFTKKPKDAVIG